MRPGPSSLSALRPSTRQRSCRRRVSTDDVMCTAGARRRQFSARRRRQFPARPRRQFPWRAPAPTTRRFRLRDGQVSPPGRGRPPRGGGRGTGSSGSSPRRPLRDGASPGSGRRRRPRRAGRAGAPSSAAASRPAVRRAAPCRHPSEMLRPGAVQMRRQSFAKNSLSDLSSIPRKERGILSGSCARSGARVDGASGPGASRVPGGTRRRPRALPELSSGGATPLTSAATSGR